MRKAGAILISVLLVLLLPLAIAEDSAKVDKAYTCLEGKVKGKCSSLASVEEQSFALFALAYDSALAGECKSALISNMKNQECWPKSACKVKDTAQAVLALNYIGADTTKPEKWLLSQNKTPSDLIWFLEIDAKDATSCTVKYETNSTQNIISMAADKKLSLSGNGNCLSLTNGNYWLQIAPSCLGRKFRVSCDKDFYTALLYKKSNSDVWHISSNTQAASAGGTTETTVNSLCFKQGGECDYEASLWATLALQQDYSIESFLPYLIALAPDNLKYNPYSFLNILSPSDEFLSNIRNAQNPAGYWDLGSGRYYDTALSLLGMKEISEDSQVLASKDWLQSVQGTDGCWPTVKDTSIILYSAWPKEPSSGIVDISEIDYCEDFGKFCTSQTECSEAEGEILSNYRCKNGLSACCSKQALSKTCSEKSGVNCASDEECSGSLASASDTSRCCIGGVCEKVETPGCERNNYACRANCASDEEVKSGSGNDCTGNDFCCGLKESSPSYWWIWLLIILIILVILAILFRHQLRLWIFRIRDGLGKGKGAPVMQTRPPFPPPFRPGMPRPMMPRQAPIQQQRAAKSKTDEELEQTLRKLKEMSN